VAEPPAVNASPLIFLARAGLLDFLQLVAETIIVPTSVLVEIQRRGPTDITAQALQNTAWIVCIEDPPIPQLIQAWDLGAGESAVLAWAYAHPDTETIIDDLAGRRCAAALGIPARGTLGLILTAKRRGRIPQARPVLERLRHAGMYLSDRIMNQALSLVGE
jgi:predicted nucleic acid-binding protein